MRFNPMGFSQVRFSPVRLIAEWFSPVRFNLAQGWICRLPGARENITACGVAPVPASTHRVS